MMHHPNMHHQPISGHPTPQHMAAHQGIPAHHQIPPHQMHRENRHVQFPRIPMGHSQPTNSMGTVPGHGQSIGTLGTAMGVPPHQGPGQRPPHSIRPMGHHPSAQHHTVPQPMKQMRRPYTMSGGYATGAVMPHYSQHPPPPSQPPHHTPLPTACSVVTTATGMSAGDRVGMVTNDGTSISTGAVGEGAGECINLSLTDVAEDEEDSMGMATGVAGQGDAEAARSAPPSMMANSKEKTPMCLVNELARYNKIKHQYRLTSETGPAHKKVFTVTLRLGDTEEYTAEGSSIKRAQHAAASAALSQTRYPAPPPRQPPPHATSLGHHRHSGTVMPTVELNALAMKLCQPAVYTAMPPVPAPTRFPRMRPPGPPYRVHPPFIPNAYNQRMIGPSLLYRVRVCVGERAWLGEGPTPQAARHDAAARALHDLRPPPDASTSANHSDSETTENGSEILISDVKSPVSMVHELALKKNLSVLFTVKSERGPPHMRVFITTCTVGEIETEGEGNGKKVSKRRAAEHMLEEMRRRWPPALLRVRPPPAVKRKPQPTKKKSRNLIKESGETNGSGDSGDAVENPISRLAMVRHATRARSPQYCVLEERGAARRREFVVQCDAPPHRATGLGPNKKTAKRRAAHNVLLAMDLGNIVVDPAPNIETASNGTADTSKITETKRKDNEGASIGCTGGSGGELRQPVPGVLLMDFHQRSGQPPPPNGVSETSATGNAGNGNAPTNTPGAKDQLMYLSRLLGFKVQFSDFPKRNHGEYLSLVSLSTEPPVMCHGGGASTAQSHEQCSRAALRALELMGLDAPNDGMPSMPGAGSKQGVLSNGITE